MIKPLYISKKDLDGYIITSYYRYRAMLQFLYNIEILAPEVIDDLYPIKEKFEKDFSHMTDDGNSYEFKAVEELANSYIRNIKVPEEITSIRTLVILEEVTFFYTFSKIIISNIENMSKETNNLLLDWSKKYNLNETEYIVIALYAIFKTIYRNKYKISKERQERQYLKEFYLYGIEIPPEIIKKRKDKNYISLSDAIPFFDCWNDRQMPERLKFNSLYPFVFAPREELTLCEREIILGERAKSNLNDIIQDLAYYETPSMYDQIKSDIIGIMVDEGKRKNTDFFIKCGKIRENDTEYINNNFNEINGNLELFMMYHKPWNESSNPIAWDPRKEAWDEFEKKINDLYKQYKEAYRRRTEEFFKNNGYIEEKAKRKDDHFKWFVWYQVQGEEPENVVQMIVNEDPKGEDYKGLDAVKRALKSTAKMVGLKSRSEL
ncbi:hypothetical protein PQ692_02585 [Thermoanaerobacterium thermosaccharolyticum]|uniref:hypothetical protein n=1 Tax=Thermoanaerobacterium thermosaccharolyticum TaxID=1517 RepID=UPI003DA85025